MLTTKLSSIADAIRAKLGTSDIMTLQDMPGLIASIPSGPSDVPFDFGGLNAELVASYYESFALADTSFVIGSSASTSATTIKTAVSNRFTSPTISIGNKDIIIVQRLYVEPTHQSTVTNKALQRKGFVGTIAYISKRKTPTSTGNTTRQPIMMTSSNISYYNTAGTWAFANTTYGFYGTLQTPSVASATAASTTIRVSSPAIMYRASSTYESTTNIKLVIDCTWDWDVEVYLVDDFTSPISPLYTDCFDFFLN